jgi:hypothetical protein
MIVREPSDDQSARPSSCSLALNSRFTGCATINAPLKPGIVIADAIGGRRGQPLTRYSAIIGVLAIGYASAERRHSVGHDLAP